MHMARIVGEVALCWTGISVVLSLALGAVIGAADRAQAREYAHAVSRVPVRH